MSAVPPAVPLEAGVTQDRQGDPGMQRRVAIEGLDAETTRRLDIYADLLVRWQRTINLVAPSTIANLWSRHIADSIQVQRAVPAARRWVDLGSGGGFPGLVTAILLAETPNARIDLVESDKRKAAFLRTVSRETASPAQIHAERIENFAPRFDDRVDAVSARALAPLPQLITMAGKFLRNGAVGVFPKGQSAPSELTALQRDHKFAVVSIPSRIDPSSSLLLIRFERDVSSIPASGNGESARP